MANTRFATDQFRGALDGLDPMAAQRLVFRRSLLIETEPPAAESAKLFGRCGPDGSEFQRE